MGEDFQFFFFLILDFVLLLLLIKLHIFLFVLDLLSIFSLKFYSEKKFKKLQYLVFLLILLNNNIPMMPRGGPSIQFKTKIKQKSVLTISMTNFLPYNKFLCIITRRICDSYKNIKIKNIFIKKEKKKIASLYFIENNSSSCLSK